MKRKRTKPESDGTIEGFRKTFPKHEFKEKNGKIMRKYRRQWRPVCIHDITSCKTCTPKTYFCECDKCNGIKTKSACRNSQLCECDKCNGTKTKGACRNSQLCECGKCDGTKTKGACRDSQLCKCGKCDGTKSRNVCYHSQLCECGECDETKSRSACRQSRLCVHEIKRFKCFICIPSTCCIKCENRFRTKGKYCTRCHPDYVESESGVSKIACEFIDAYEKELKTTIIHRHCDYVYTKSWVGGEFRPLGWKKKPVDGLFKGTKDVLEFNGDEFHGHPSRLEKKTHNMYGNSYVELFEETKRSYDKLVKLGYTVWYVWEYDYLNKPAFNSLNSIVREYRGVLEY